MNEIFDLKKKGHSFRRSAASIMANNGCGAHDLKLLGGWRNMQTCDRYIDECKLGKKRLALKLIGRDKICNIADVAETNVSEDNIHPRKKLKIENDEISCVEKDRCVSYSFNDCTTVNFNFN